jgi:broad specificity phosphatase PhoE
MAKTLMTYLPEQIKPLTFLSERAEQSLVVITHGHFLRTIVSRVLLGTTPSGEAFRQFQKSTAMENTALTVLRYHGVFEEEPSWRLWIYNDYAHLG